MRKFARLDEPEILKQNWTKWGTDYETKRAATANYRFSWPLIEKQKLNHVILPYLVSQTDGHCSYCDNYHMKRGDFTIDHFKPKSDSRFYSIVCKWDNLFFCCGHCQEAKGEKFSEYLLRPDADDYMFSKYFSYDFTEHEILANESASPEDQQRASETIKIFDLNHNGLKKARRFSFNFYQKEKIDSMPLLSDFNYRFILE